MNLVAFEWRYHTRQVTFLAGALLFFGIGFILTGTGFGSRSANVNSPFNIVESIGLASLASVFILAIFCANAIVRDREHQMEEIVFTTAVRKSEYLGGRFAGAFLASFTAFSTTTLGMIAATFMPWHDPQRIGPFEPLHYAGALAAIALPGMLFAAVLLFGIATLTRSVVASVVGAVFLYVLYFIVAAMTNSPLMASSRPGGAGIPGAALLDPFGLSPFFEQTRYWSAIEKNSALVSLSGDFLLNRIIWIAASLVLWAAIYRRFSFRLLPSASKKSSAATISTSLAPEAVAVPVAFQRASNVHAFLSLLRLEIRSWLLTVPFALITVLWAALAGSEMIGEIRGGEYGSALLPTTGILMSAFAQPFSLLATIVIIYYAAEIVWRERTVGFAEIAHATPASGNLFVFAKWLTLALMMAVLAAAGMLTAVAIQVATGYTRLEPAALFTFGWTAIAPVIVFAMAAIFLQTIVPHKYAGMISVLLLTVILFAGGYFGLEHPLLRFGATTPIVFSAMNGFGASLAPFHWFIGFWFCAGLLLLLVASAVWKSGVVFTGRRRARGETKGTRVPMIAMTFAGALTLILGLSIFYSTNVLNRFETGESTLAWKAAYERKYRSLTSLPHPEIAAITGDVEIHPAERRVRLRGRYRLVNRGRSPIGKLFVAVRRDVSRASLDIANATQTADREFGVHAFDLASPLAPGGEAELDFDLLFETRGFSASGDDPSVAENGTILQSWRLFPSIGYRRGYEIGDPAERRRRGLPPIQQATAGDIASGGSAQSEWIDADLTISTDADQVIVSSGSLIESSTVGPRRIFRYRTEAPIPNVITIASARYAETTATSGGTKIRLLYDPQHSWNRDAILHAASASLAEFERSFGPYPHDTLTIAESPAYVPYGGFATPGVVFLNEKRAFLVDGRDPRRIDLVLRRVAHEVAHQWWGHQVSPAAGPGASTVVESVTKYAELEVLEEVRGRAMARDLLARELDFYLEGRAESSEPEPPLTRVGDESWLYYRKGAIVLHAIRDLLGRERLDQALRSFVARHAGPGKRPTATALMQEIERDASPDERQLIREWMNDVVLYDLQVESASVLPLSDGRFDVRLRVRAGRVRVDAGGREHALPFEEAIAVTLEGEPGVPPLHEAKHLLRAGMNDLRIIVAKRPQLAAVDPDVTRLDRDLSNNSTTF